nr:uncharacterized mitochondrial protein AtMg00810-like [Tanacetum cinerariifolium]
MSTQQDIYAAGSKSHPLMINKENYVPWSSRLLRYAKSRPNGKLIHNSIINGPYVRRMILEPGDTNRDVPVNETFHVQTNDELTKKELKQIEADDQAIQTILLGLPEDIYAAEIWLRVQQMIKGSDIGIQEKKAKNKHFPEKIASNLKFLNNLQPEWSRHVTIVRQTKDLHTADYTQLYDFLKYNQKENGLISVQGNGNQNQIRNGNLMAARTKGNAAGQNGNQIRCYNCRGVDLDEIEEVNANCILMANLQQASTSGTQFDKAPVYDSDGSAEVHENCDDNEIFNMFTQEEQYTELLKPMPESHQVPQNDNNVISEVTSVEQGGETVEQHPANFEETRALYDSLYQNLAIEVEKVNSVNLKLKETNAEIERLLREVVSQDIISVVQKESIVDTSDLQTELERTKERFENCIIKKENEYAKLWNDCTIYKNAKLRTQLFKKVSDLKDKTRDTSMNTKFAKKSIEENLPKVDETHALSKPVNSNSVSTPQEPKVVRNDKVIAPGMFRINPFMTSREEKQTTLRPEDHILEAIQSRIGSPLRLRVFEAKIKKLKKHKANVSIIEKQKKHQPHVMKPKKVGFLERLATPKPRKPKFLLRLFDQEGNIVDSSESKSKTDCSNGDNACTSNTMEPKIKRFPNSTSLLGRLSRFVCEVVFRRNACFVRNLEGVDLLKRDRSTNLYTINLHDMASASPICLMACASSTKSWLWHQWLSHLNFDTINDLARNDLVSGLPKFKYNKKYLCPSCEQGKSKRASHPPKIVPNSRQRLHLLHMDLCGPMTIASINEKRYVLVIVDDYFRYTWVHFLRSKDEAPEVIITFLKRITVLLQSRVIILRTDNGTKFKNQVLKEYFDSVGISHQMYSVRTPQQNRVVERRNWTLVEAARTMTKKIMETMNVSFDELSAMDFEQRSSKPRIQSMTYGQISSGLDLTYALSTITTQQPTEGELDLLFEAMYDNYIGGQPLATARTVSPAQEPQNHFFKGTIDPTLFIRSFQDGILVVQVYVDDIIFGSTHPRYIQLFFDLMKSRFEMSMMGEMTFFLSLQVNQSPCGIFINQSKYMLEILKKYEMESCDPVGTPMEIKDKLDLDKNGTPVDPTKYNSMIGALMYLTSSRPDIVHVTCLCARYQAKTTEKHLKEVKRIFRYLRGTVNTDLWYTKDSGFELTGFSDADYARCKDTFKSTSGGAQFLGKKLVSWSSKKQVYMALSTAEAEYVSLSACCAQVLWM